jgi:hypothetical protein
MTMVSQLWEYINMGKGVGGITHYDLEKTQYLPAGNITAKSAFRRRNPATSSSAVKKTRQARKLDDAFGRERYPAPHLNVA